MKSLLFTLTLVPFIASAQVSSVEAECQQTVYTGRIKLFTPNTAYLYQGNEDPKVLIWKKGGIPSELSQQIWLGHFYLSRKKLSNSMVVICGSPEEDRFISLSEIQKL